jgi:hypothetical protein
MKIKKIIITVLLVVAIFGISTSAKAMTIQDFLRQTAKLQSQLRALLAKQNGTQTWCHTFNTNLKYGDNGSEVSALRTALSKEGIPVNNTEDVAVASFDDSVASAVVQFQEKYARDVLTPSKLKHGTGYVGLSTRAKLNTLYGCKTISNPTLTPTSTSTTTPTSTPNNGLTLDALKNMYVDYAHGGQLNNGQYLSPVINLKCSTCPANQRLYLGLDSATAVFGDFDNDGSQEAVVSIRYGYVDAKDDLVTASADAKTEFLALVKLVNGQPKIINKIYGPTDVFGLWERIHSIVFYNGQLAVDVTESVNYGDTTGEHEIRRIYQINVSGDKLNIISVTPIVPEMVKTEVIKYHQFYIPKESRNGSCWARSIAALTNDMAWRCTIDKGEISEIFDPCFETESHQIVCDVDPEKPESGFVLKLKEPLPYITITKKINQNLADKDWPWRVKLKNGETCVAITGTALYTGEKLYNYSCRNNDNNISLMMLTKTEKGSLWKAEKAYLSKKSGKIIKTEDVEIIKAWE